MPAGTASHGTMDAWLQARWGWLPYRLMAGVALVASGVVLGCDLMMWFMVPGYDPVGETISELAAGLHHDVQDSGIVVFVIGILALAAGFTLRGEAGWRAWIVRAAFVLLAVDIALIALWNEYGDGDIGGLILHPYLVALLYGLVFVILWYGTAAAPAGAPKLGRAGRIAALFWLVAAPFFYVVPDSINGAYERMLALVMVGAVVISAIALYRRPEPRE